MSNCVKTSLSCKGCGQNEDCKLFQAYVEGLDVGLDSVLLRARRLLPNKYSTMSYNALSQLIEMIRKETIGGNEAENKDLQRM